MEISVEVCTKCRRLFNYPGFGPYYCPQCRSVDDQHRNIVKDYIRKHGTATMFEICENTGVTEKEIRYYLRDGTLEIPDGSPVYISCERCGCDIRSGRWCQECAMQLSKNLKVSFALIGDRPKIKNEGKMRFLRRRIGLDPDEKEKGKKKKKK